MQIGTRDIFDSDHDMFREMTRNFFMNEVAPFHAEWEKAGEVPRELWTQAGELGLLSNMVPEEYGGLGLDCKYPAIVWEEQSYSGCTGPGFAMHSDIVAPYITNYGTEEQKKRILPKLVSGEWIGALAMTEPSAGSDFAGIKTTAKEDGDDYIINGSKVFITNGWLCDVVIVCAKTDAGKGAHGVSLFLVEDGMKGFIKGQKLNKMGLKAQDTSELFFEDLRVPASAMLGPENKGFYCVMQELPQERLLIGDMGVAAAEAVFEWTKEYVMDRKAFKGSLSDLQTVKHRLAEMKTETVVARSFMDQCIALHAEGKLDTQMASMAKYYGSDLQSKIANDGVQLHGGWGYMWEYPVCRAYVDARVQSIYGGANEIMKEVIARQIVAKPKA
jgi:long-chain-acyl-CoA dehydrogenase